MRDQPKLTGPQPPPGGGYRWFFLLLVVAFGALNWWLWRVAFLPAKPGKPGPPKAIGPYQKEPDAEVYARYGGSSSCQECHREAYARWQGSHHALAERALLPALDRIAFDPPRAFRHGSQLSEARMEAGRFEIVTLGPGGIRRPFALQRVIGMDPLLQYLVPEPGGRLQVTEVAYDPAKGDWFNVYGEEDRQPGEWGHWTGRGMTWNVMCAYCHNTRVRKNYQETNDTYATRMAEMGVGCESCHGPMASHLAWQKRHPYQKGDPTVRRFNREQMLAVCGSCHARRGEYTGDFHPGEEFFDHYSLTIPDETDTYYPDGQVRDEDYEFTAFLGSRMSAAKVWCLDCHDPHSAKVKVADNALCQRCHAPPVAPAPRIDAARHSFHKPNTAGDLCMDCHMPQTPYMQRHWRHDHGFTLPDPLLTKQFNIPNACNRCHKDRTPDWALEWVEKWYGPRMERPYRARTQTIARARAGQRDARDGLMKIAREEKIAFWRAVAVGLLRRWSWEPAVAATVWECARDEEPLVRAVAVRALELAARPASLSEPAALQRLLTDPARAVRVETAWALRATLDTNAPAARELLAYLRENADQPAGLFQRGVFHLDRGEAETALGYFQRATNWDSGSAPLRHALAVGLSALGRNEAAVRELEAACRLAPREAEYRFKLGLALNEAGRLAEAVAALQEAVKLEPEYAQAWYNLGLAFNAREEPERALEALSRAEVLDARSAQIPYAQATILVRLGRTTEARRAAQRALDAQPNHAEAAQLLRTLPP